MISNHGLDLIERDEDGKEYRTSRLFICGDYVGDSVTEANIRYVQRHYPDAEWWTLLTESYHTRIMAFDLPNVPEDFAERLDKLADYPVFDDELITIIEDEWLEQAVDSWAAHDTARLLGLEDYDKDKLASAIIDACYGADGRWHCNDRNSMFIDTDNPDYLAAVRKVYEGADDGTCDHKA